ncbi:aldehyde dehydrogenase family protein [Nocardioides sp. CFH 31398]|uniref:aldehyde dehydrogenase family protein n=1 Tax=Nocardioides sp. CFH 31398 TaxID=2919579 RepID=UPI001F06792F|nr:aldehyde dehydrogenase family protein [Nocardioides sp. CFH 31398]MCH1867829.1 aldehyde dehydrogenase family protein [Nocardioides sp. CFH 31398]
MSEHTRAVFTVDPATGLALARYPVTTPDGVDEAVAAAYAAQRAWAARPVEDRTAVLRHAARLLRERVAPLASLMTAEMGKPVTEARGEVEKCAWVCEHYAEVSPGLLADRPVAAGGSRSWVRHEPLGVVLAVMPWNFPLWQVFRFAAPALAAGNAALLKHSPNVTGTALAVGELLADAGLPDDVLRVLVLDEPDVPATVERIVADDRVAAVTLTGSNRAGSAVGAAAGREVKKSVLELGGSDPFVVLDDADLDVAVAGAVRARYLNSGQSCLCAKRFVVAEGLADEFGARLADAVAALRVGDPTDPGTQVGPLARPDLAEALHKQVEASVAAGAVVLTGGTPLDAGPAWYAPTVLTAVTPDMPVMAEETFGPVAAVARAADDDEAVALANATPYGLGASVWSADVERALAVGARISSGALFVNAVTASDPRLPFGGVKRSGYGRELGDHGAVEFTNVRTILVG